MKQIISGKKKREHLNIIFLLFFFAFSFGYHSSALASAAFEVDADELRDKINTIESDGFGLGMQIGTMQKSSGEAKNTARYTFSNRHTVFFVLNKESGIVEDVSLQIVPSSKEEISYGIAYLGVIVKAANPEMDVDSELETLLTELGFFEEHPYPSLLNIPYREVVRGSSVYYLWSRKNVGIIFGVQSNA